MNPETSDKTEKRKLIITIVATIILGNYLINRVAERSDNREYQINEGEICLYEVTKINHKYERVLSDCAQLSELKPYFKYGLRMYESNRIQKPVTKRREEDTRIVFKREDGSRFYVLNAENVSQLGRMYSRIHKADPALLERMKVSSGHFKFKDFRSAVIEEGLNY